MSFWSPLPSTTSAGGAYGSTPILTCLLHGVGHAKLLSLTLFDLICLKNSDEHFTPPSMVGSKPLSDRLLSSKLFFRYFIFSVDI